MSPLEIIEEEQDMELSPKLKKLLLASCLFSLCLGSMMLLNLDTFLPIFCEETLWNDDAEVNNLEATVILVVFALTQIVFAPFNSIIKNRFGAKNTIIFGFVLMTATTFGLGLISYTNNAKLFLGISIALRFF